MPLPKEFWEQLPKRSDGEIVNMLDHKNEYTPDAMLAVEAELRKRKLNPEQLRSVAAATKSEKSAALDARAKENAGWPVLFLAAFPIPIFVIILAVTFHKEGYKRKSDQVLIAAALPWGLFAVVGILVKVVSSLVSNGPHR